MCEKYAVKYDYFLRNITNIMYTFEVTKSCGYSAFITVYKTQTMKDLYSNLSAHFQTTDIKELYFISTNNERIDLPMNEMNIKDFVSLYVRCSPVKLIPTYPLPCPVVYKLYIVF
jgi:hypothetical protein